MSRNKWIAVAVGVLVVGFFLFGGTAQNLFRSSSTGVQNEEIGTTIRGQMVIQDRIVGTGAEAKTGSKVTVHYVGMLQDGKIFDSSLQSGTPFAFTIGAGEVIAGWEQGIAGMKVGGRRVLAIPPALGYGAQPVADRQGNLVIPPNSNLIFEVELLKVE